MAILMGDNSSLRGKVHELLELLEENESWVKGTSYKAYNLSTHAIVIASLLVAIILLIIAHWPPTQSILLGIFLVAIGTPNLLLWYKNNRFVKKWDKRYYTARDAIKAELAG